MRGATHAGSINRPLLCVGQQRAAGVVAAHLFWRCGHRYLRSRLDRHAGAHVQPDGRLWQHQQPVHAYVGRSRRLRSLCVQLPASAMPNARTARERERGGGGAGGRAWVPRCDGGHPPAEITCSAVTDNYISWPQTLSGEAATGACVPGWAATGSVAPTRECQLTGAFDTVSGSCYRTASACLRAGAHAPPQRATRAMC